MKNMTRFSLFAIVMVVLAFLPGNARTDYAGGTEKMDLQLRMLVDEPSSGKAMLGKAITPGDGVELVDVLIKSYDPQITAASIEESGGRVRSVVGSIMTAYVPMGELTAISGLPEVVALEASKQLTYFMDTARSSANTGVASLQTTYDGTNVVVGVIDSGLDYSRSDFTDTQGGTRVQYMRFQTVQGDGSVAITECAKDYIDSGDCTIPASNDSAVGHGTHIAGIAAGSDNTYTGVAPAADIMLVRNDFDDDIDEGGADSGTFSGGVIDGVVEIFKKSDIIDKAAVVNISQGTHIGAHDNTSLMEEALNSAVAGGYDTDGRSYGRIIAAAAGNEHLVASQLTDLGLGTFIGGIHAEVSVPSGSSYAWRLWVIGATSPGRTPLIVDSWFGTGQSGNCTVRGNAYQYGDVFDNFAAFDPILPAGTTTTNGARVTTGELALSSDTSVNDSDGTAAIAAATDSSDTQNSKPRAIFSYGPSSGTSWDNIAVVESDGSTTNPQAYFLDVIVRASGGTCSGDIWMEGGGSYVSFMGGIDTGAYDVADGANGDGYAMMDGDSNQTVAIPATASGVIGVGSYLQTKPEAGCPSQSCWTDTDGIQHDATNPSGADATQAQINGGTVQGRSPFSSIGPPAYSYSGYKPDVMAPGDPIISTMATGYTPAWNGSANNMLIVDSTKYKSQGTSQASPHAAGVVALMMQKNNTLTASQAKAALTSTASRASSPTNDVGYGNVNAPNALGSVSQDTGGYSGTGDLAQADLGGGGGGGSSSSCGGTIAPAAVATASPVAIVAMLPLLLLALRRKS
jgi:subtilisin family serine protease